MNIEKNSVVAIRYKLTDDEGTVVDSSEEQKPLTYLHGGGSIISGLESALDGRTTGDVFQVTIQPAEGYGDINSEMIQTVPRSAFEGIENLEPGMPLQADDGNGNVHHVIVREVNDQEVTIDVNHPLAGKVLHFDVTVESVREAAPEELAHGHAH